MLKMYLNDEEVTVEELRAAWNNLAICPMDGGDYESIELDEIDDEGNLHFSIYGHSTF